MRPGEVWDIIVIGGGPAGLSAAINGAADGFRTLLLEKTKTLGGQIRHTSLVENLAGFPKGVSGPELIAASAAQALKFGAEIRYEAEIRSIRVLENLDKLLTTRAGEELRTKTVVIAAGLKWKRLGIENLTGMTCFGGVYYGAGDLNALKYEGQEVVIIGGANSAGQAAMHFSTHAKSVTMLVRGSHISEGMSEYLVKRVLENPKISVHYHAQVEEVLGEAKCEAVCANCSGERKIFPASAAFIFIGSEPATKFFGVKLNAAGYIVVDRYFHTSLPGVFAIGDVRDGVAKRVSAAMGDGGGVVSCAGRWIKHGQVELPILSAKEKDKVAA